MRCLIVCELATNHGGDFDLAKDMISAAADAGADIVKTQGYQIKHLRRTDPQYEWFRQCELTQLQHSHLKTHAESCGVEYLSTAFRAEDLAPLRELRLRSVKVGSGEGRSGLVWQAAESFGAVYATVPWGVGVTSIGGNDRRVTWLATVPLYPAPLETYSRVNRLAGYSDHHVGLEVAKIAIAQGATVLEKHFHIPGRGRNQEWNMTPDDLRELRRWAEVCAQANDGTKFQGRWTA